MLRIMKGYFITGLLIIIPLVVTMFIFFEALDQVDKLIPYSLFGIPRIPGLGILMVVAIILFTGFATRYYFGQQFITIGDKLVARIPIVSRIYEAIKQILQTFFSDDSDIFKKVVLIEYPRKGIYSIGFFTQDTKGVVQDSLKEDVVSVFLPTTPNPTSGFLLFVPKAEVITLNLKVEEAMKLIVSGGAIVPPSERISSPFIKFNKMPAAISKN